jgi:hypothetical protein
MGAPYLPFESGFFSADYHISYWAGERGTANVRKNAGFRWVATGKDSVVLAPADAFQIVRLYKRGGRIRLTVDDVIEAAFDDDDGMTKSLSPDLQGTYA